MKKYNGKDIAVSAIALILVVIVSAVLGVLKNLEVLKCDASAFIIMLTSLTLGCGIYVLIFSIVKKGGYEFAVGSILTVIGVFCLLFVLKVDIVINIIVTVALLLIAFIAPFLLKAKDVSFTPTDKEEGYKPYMEKLKEEKEQEKEEELPEIKSFK